MSFLESLVLSITMAADAMCVGASDGIKEHNIKITKCLVIALAFGFAQFLMPLIGYFVGFAIYEYIKVAIPWIAFSVLLLLGVKSIWEGIKKFKERKKQKEDEEKVGETIIKVKPFEIFVQSIATSIDALSVGFSLVGVLNVISEAIIVFVIIGIVTFLLTFLTTFFGKQIGKYVEKYAPFISGLIFVALAIKFLVDAIKLII